MVLNREKEECFVLVVSGKCLSSVATSSESWHRGNRYDCRVKILTPFYGS